VVIAVFLLAKTPSIVIACVVTIFLLMCHPILVLAPMLTTRKWVRPVGMTFLALSCFGLAVNVWPDTEPISDLATDQSVIQRPYTVGLGANLNLDYFKTTTNIRSRGKYLTEITFMEDSLLGGMSTTPKSSFGQSFESMFRQLRTQQMFLSLRV
jgi:hypothetical protein